MHEQLKNKPRTFINNPKEYAVCIPLIKKENDYYILFEVRSSTLSRQPNEICFPGGKKDKEDASTYDTVIRECKEELLIQDNQLRIIDQLDGNIRIHSIVDVFIGELNNYENTFNEEVQSVFLVPLSYFIENEPKLYYTSYQVKPDDNFPFNDVPNGKDYQWAQFKEEVPFYYYEDKVIWGLTARVLYHNLENIKKYID